MNERTEQLRRSEETPKQVPKHDPAAETKPRQAVDRLHQTKLGKGSEILVRTAIPIILALAVGDLIIWAMGVNPLEFYGNIFYLGIAGAGWQRTLTAMAPLLIIGLGLIIAFRAQLWNLGYNGAYLLAGAVVAGIAPGVMGALPLEIGFLLLFVFALIIGIALGTLPAFLKARYGTNEIITSLMVSFISISLAIMLGQGPCHEASVDFPSP